MPCAAITVSKAKPFHAVQSYPVLFFAIKAITMFSTTVMSYEEISINRDFSFLQQAFQQGLGQLALIICYNTLISSLTRQKLATAVADNEHHLLPLN